MDFFIGYNWPVPSDLRRVLTRAALGLGVGAIGLSGALAAGHRQLAGGLFEFGNVTGHTGTIVAHPHPMLRPADGRTPWPLLVNRGKHGAHESVRGLDGHDVNIEGTRIVRGRHEMLELESVEVTDAGLKPRTDATDVEAGLQPRAQLTTLIGEIVDSKCFLGVMVPGEGGTHRACAALCLRGGIPAALHVTLPGGASALYLIAGPAGTKERAVAWAGESVEMTGTLTQQGGWHVLTTEPAGWRRLER